jgi:hypothetical protein
MTTIISLDGGLGRIITSIPALLKYHKRHRDEEWYITIPGWDFITWGFPELQERTFNPDARGSFDLFWKADQVISPEPYLLPAYYRNEISLREAFDVCINNSTDHSDLPPMQINLSFAEKRKAYEILEQAKSIYKKSKTIVLQPYGSTATPHPLGIYDDSLRSIPKLMLDYFISELSKDYNLIFMGAKEFHNIKTYKKEYYDKNKEKIAVKNKETIICECGIKITKGKINRHLKSKRHEQLLNGSYKTPKKYEKVICECGAEVVKPALWKHKQSKKHKDIIDDAINC